MNTFPLRLFAATAAVLIASVIIAASVLLVGYVSYVALTGVTGPAVAGLLTALGGCAFAAAIVLVARRLLPSRGPMARPVPRGEQLAVNDRQLAELGGVLGSALAAFVRARPYEAAAGSLVTGFALGASPRLRALLRDLM